MSSTNDGLPPDSVIPYLFDIPGNATLAAVYAILAALHFWRYFSHKPYRGNGWSLSLPIAEVCMFIGFILRIVNRDHPTSLALYAVCNLFVVLSPTAFIAFAYMMYSRIIDAHEDPDSVPNNEGRSEVRRRSTLAPLPPRLIGRFLIASDISCFLIQGAGGGLQAVGGQSAITGTNIFLAGVTLQAVCYSIYILLVLFTHHRIRKTQSSRGKATTLIFTLLYLFSVGIMIRSIFRIVEFAGGYSGHLYQTEIYLFLLDSLPLALGNIIWVVRWPTPILKGIKDSQPQTQSLDRQSDLQEKSAS